MAKTIKLSQRGIGDLQRSMERYETYNDGFILPDTLLVVRLDAHRYGDWSSFTDEYPTGPVTTKALLITARALMNATFRVVLSYVHGDEISLVLDPTENANPLRRSKLISAFTSAASIHFLKACGFAATFDAKVSELPSLERLTEYLFWQRRYCYRNATTIALRKSLITRGHSAEQAESKIHGATEEQRISQLKAAGTPVESIPHTTRRGSLLFWETVQQDGKDQVKVVADTRLPDDDDAYEALLQQRLAKALNLRELKSAPPQHSPNKSPQSPVVAKTRTEEKPKTPPQPLPPHPHTPKRTKKAQVSVFRVPNSN
jgi:tRNA(His) 5'-end guanylyltransferase